MTNDKISEAAKVREQKKREKAVFKDVEINRLKKELEDVRRLHGLSSEVVKEKTDELQRLHQEKLEAERDRDTYAGQIIANYKAYNRLLTGLKLIAIAGILITLILSAALGWLYAQPRKMELPPVNKVVIAYTKNNSYSAVMDENGKFYQYPGHDPIQQVLYWRNP